MIYLCSNTPSDDESVVHLALTKLEFFKFSVDLGEFDALVISSKNAIKALGANSITANSGILVCAIGKATAETALEYGFSNVLRAQNSHGEDFANEIATKLKGLKTLLLSPKEQVSDIAGILEFHKIKCDKIIAYENSIITNAPKMDFEKGSVFIFTSPINAKAFLANYAWQDDFKAIAIGKSTANAINFTKPIISDEQNIQNCIKMAKNLL